MRLLLINPPLCVHEFPHLALPILKGYLKQQNIICDTVDYNVYIMDDIISDGLEKVVAYFNTRGMLITSAEVRRKFHEARQIYRMKDQQGKEERAQRLINTYLRIAGSNIFDVCFRPDSLQKIKDGYAACDFDTSSNKIIRFLRETALTEIIKKEYEIIGISVPYTSQLYYALVLGRAIKRALPKCKVLLGGPQISLFWNVLTKHEPFREAYDGLMYGQGEKALEGYINATENNSGIRKVPNLIHWEKNRLVVNDEQNVCSMTDLPIPDFSDLPLDKYIYAKLPYQMSRGCYWSKCAFCSYREDHKQYDVRKVEQVCDHLAYLEKTYDRHLFQFIDDAIHPNILSKLADLMIQRDMDIRYDAYLRLDAGFTAELCLKLAKSGLKNVLFGMESANQRILNLMRKGNDPKNMLRVMKNMKAAGIKSILSCLIGFPTETEQEAWESIQYLKENREWYYWVYIVHFGMISDMRNDTEKYGIKKLWLDDLIRYDDTGFTALGYPYETTIGMTVEEALSVIKKGRKELGITIFGDNFFS